jgi:cyclic beta-1,2-glucan synthetase
MNAAAIRAPPAIEAPIAAEMFSVERLEQYAAFLARTQEIAATDSTAISLHARLRTNATILNSAYRTLLAGIRRSTAMTPAAEWLVDNYYVIDEHIRAIRRDLPPTYYRQLPKLANGPLRGYPRVYGIAWSIVAHSDSHFELDTLYRFCRAYQRIQPLSIGELWAIAITLRVVLIDNLGRLAAGIVQRMALRQEANALADELLLEPQGAARAPSNLPKVEAGPLAQAFAAQLFQRLRDLDPAKTPALSWLHGMLAAHNTSADDIVHDEHQRQGAVNVSVRNVITSLRLISSVDWAKFFESVSLVDELMRTESAFGSFDFSTRDLYRHAIEDLARGSRQSEIDVARRAIDAARRAALRDAEAGTGTGAGAAAAGARPREHEPGFYLVADGRPALELELAYAIPWNQRVARITRALGLPGYVGTVAGLSTGATAACVALAGSPSGHPAVAAATLALAVLAASDPATTLVNWWVTHFCRPSILPGLELIEGVPPELRTIVALPVLLTSLGDIEAQVQSLEVHYLATQDGDIHFALLSDWLDADSESTVLDAPLLAAAAGGVARLNRIYGDIHGDARFLLLHRKRQWNAAEGRWMGWERKRGKLHEFNRLLMGAGDTSFIAQDGVAPRVPGGVRYVISLDVDTQLPRGAALSLIGKMAHPLNRPAIDLAERRVTAGYGILQPRVTPALANGLDSSIFQRAFSGPSGIDPYAFAVSDVYQDLFGEGSYTGKGIYDVAVFEATLSGRVDQNELLSHDLYEGIYARCGLASDIEVVEEYPARYDVAGAREHRWTRGDWQLLPWILGMRPKVPALGRCKMLDNLRRSLLNPACLLLLVLCWLGPAPIPWTLFVFAAMSLPVVIPLCGRLAPRLADLTSPGYLSSYLGTCRVELGRSLQLLALRLIFWADKSWCMSDAIGRALYRLTVSRQHLLQWTSTAQSKAGAVLGAGDFYRRMAGGTLLTVGIAGLLAWSAPGLRWIAVPFLIAWAAAPTVARRVSKPKPRGRTVPLTGADRQALRMMARQTWSFFDTFVTVRQNMLPPDNFQELPKAVIANRTSPTNIGLYLLSIVAARDFGWIGARDAMSRLESTFATLEKLERFRGHLYNWYDTHDLRPLDPKYISTVDSGNLAGHLIALAAACRNWPAKARTAAICLRGIEDTLDELTRVARTLDDERRNYGVSLQQLDVALQGFRRSLHARADGSDMSATLAALQRDAAQVGDIANALTDERGEGNDAPLPAWAAMLTANVASHVRDAAADEAVRKSLEARAAVLAHKARAFALSMEFGFLVEPARQLLSIGFRAAERIPDPSCYDLLASEARLTSFFAIAKGDLPVRHWFRLGRLLTTVDGNSALMSWSGSMFEYLMPVLVMREPEGGLLGDTAHLVVRRQIEYGAERKLPWGVSESAFNARDREWTYQYSSFGVPGLGLQRGLEEQAVVAPYATALAAMVDAKAAVGNFARLEQQGGRGRFGWFDALDFTPARLPQGKDVVAVRAYMAHHQGMIVLSIANVLHGGTFRDLFHADPMIQATELLLQERTPRDADRAPSGSYETLSAPELRELAAAVPRYFTSPHHIQPRTHLLSNGNYSVMINAAGSGYSRWRDTAVTRWLEDSTCDPWGSYVFLRDVTNGQVWSAGYQPVGREPDRYEVSFFEDRAEIVRRDGPIITMTEIVVSPEDDAEVRRVSLTNTGNRVCEIELTTYSEVVLTTPDTDAAHPAFAKLFVQTEFVPGAGTLLATRRTREPDEQELWAAHVSVLEGEAVGGLQFETDRARFLGRGRDLRSAVSVVDARPLSNTTGTVLDPVLCLRRRVRVPPGATAHVAFWTILAQTRAAALSLADKHRDTAAFDRAKTLAWTQAQVQLRYLGIAFAEAQDFQRIANRVLYADSSLRASRTILGRNVLGPSTLWAHGISGDIPIVLLRIDEENDIEIVKQLLRAHEYWRLKRLAVDLVILNDRPPSYASELEHAIDSAIRGSRARGQGEEGVRRGGIFSLRGDLIPAADSDLLQTAARAVFVARRGSLSAQLARLREPDPVPRARLLAAPRAPRGEPPRGAAPTLEYFNSLGGFAADGREYVTVLDEGQHTPAPWINVVANPQFGFQVSTDGAGTTWSRNAHENQITSWSNDPVSDPPSEAIYIRDEVSGDLWCATPLPIRQPAASYTIHHGFGYSRFEHLSHGIELDLTMFVPPEDAVKISRLKLVNRGTEVRQLSIVHYVEWVLGNQRSRTAAFIVTELEPRTAALLARNPWRTEFQSRVAFIDMLGKQQACTGDRAEFLGRHGSLSEPAALVGGKRLSNRVGGGLDPCGALQTRLTLSPGEATELVFLLGEAESNDAAVTLMMRYRSIDLTQVIDSVTDHWNRTLHAIQVKTPDRTIDLLVNGWLLYQTLVCRVWARTGFYQSSGAYGFRDQLQDVMALCVSRAELAREHILRAAARQFAAGDVQHWWLPASGQGVQTRVSDDRVWLPFVVCHYLEVTADRAILDELLPFLEGPPLTAEQHEVFASPAATATTASLFDHCVLALDSSLAIGSHGLPLFGAGDWNDGMNRVGAAGRGESVWLAWFLHATLLRFALVAEARGAASKAAWWRKHAFAMQQAIEREAWDGDWYRRGYFDDGTPLGSVSNDECRIDSIAQSWAVISGGADPERVKRAMSAVDSQLVSRSDGLVKIFTPPFNHGTHDPGYIQAYPPGIRENGGQYTHAAMWTTLAVALMGDGDRALELFSLLNPINHASTRAGIHRYRVEPYVVCADVYCAESHVGRGGWTWYTGSAGWMYRTAVEGMLGINPQGDLLSINPCIPRAWSGFEVTYRHRSARYHIVVDNPHGVCRGIERISLDDREITTTDCVRLVDDGSDHQVRVTLGPARVG